MSRASIEIYLNQRMSSIELSKVMDMIDDYVSDERSEATDDAYWQYQCHEEHCYGECSK